MVSFHTPCKCTNRVHLASQQDCAAYPPTNLCVQVALVADEGVGDALVSAEQRQVEGNAALRIALVKLVGQLQAMKGTELKGWDR